MKKIISVALIFALLMCFASCGGGKDTTTTVRPNDTTTIKPDDTTTTVSNEPDPPPSETVYDVLNRISKEKYQKVKISITTVTGDVSLSANYTLISSSVQYSIEQLNKLPVDGNFDGMSPNYKVILTGTATIENGKVTKLDGADVTLPSYDELKGNFNFSEDNLTSITTQSGKLTASAKSPSKLLGTDKSLTDMKITVEYSATALKKITLTYKTSDSTVTTVYEFEK